MSINPKNRPQTQPQATTPAPQPKPAIPVVISARPASEANGYLDPDQTLINFAVRELGYSFERIIQEDPNRLLRSWGKTYKTAKMTAIGTTVMGAGAVLLGVLVGATPLLVVGVLVGGASGLLVKKHSAGVESCDIEHEVLDDCRPVLAFLAELERRGVNPSDLVSLYDRVIKRVSINPGRFSSASILQKLFKDEVEQSGVLAQVSGVKTGLGAVAPPASQTVPMALPEGQAIGNATQLGAVEVSMVATNDREQAKQALLHQMQEHAKLAENQSPDIVDLLLRQGNSLAFFGSQRCGKSRLMAIASRKGMESGKFKHVTVLSSLAKADEDPHYWSHATFRRFHDLAPMSHAEKERIMADWLQRINAFRQAANTETPGLLIIDEYVFLSTLCANAADDSIAVELAKAIVDVITVVESGGAKRGWHLWIGCPSCAVSGLGFMGRAMKKLTLVFCAIAKGESINTKGVDVSWHAELYEAVKTNFKSLREPQGSEAAIGGRIVFFNGVWMTQTQYQLEEKPEIDITSIAKQVSDYYNQRLLSDSSIKPQLLAMMAQVKSLKSRGDDRAAFAAMIAPLGSKTAFCKALGITGGSEFQRLSDIYDWAKGEEIVK